MTPARPGTRQLVPAAGVTGDMGTTVQMTCQQAGQLYVNHRRVCPAPTVPWNWVPTTGPENCGR